MQPKNITLKNSLFKVSKLSFSVALGGALLTQFGITTFAEANEIVQNEVVPSINKKNLEADFDSGFLYGNASELAADTFKFNNPVLPGEYNLDVYVNAVWQGRKRMVFKAEKDQENATLCFTKKQLEQYGVKSDLLERNPIALNPDDCLAIDHWVEAAFYDFDNNKLRLDISIPQISLNTSARGAVDQRLWDRGINAGFVSYNGGVFKTHNQGENSHISDTTSAYVGVTTGINLLGWQIRHNGQWRWMDQGSSSIQSSYDANNTYIQRAFPKYRGVLTLGESSTSGDVLDSVRFRGVDFSSDEQMLPNSQSGYAPIIRGSANSNAKVEIRQKGQLIYQTAVAPGPFEINDLYPSGFGGELEVTVLEASGEKQIFSVPYAAVPKMLRPGLERYSLTVGQFDESSIDEKPWFTQAKYQRGLNNYLTLLSGMQWLDGYAAVTLGGAMGTPVGAVSLDVTHSRAEFDQQGTKSGQSYRISYSKLFDTTSTNLTLAAYRYSTENYYSMRDAVQIMDYEKKNINSLSLGKQRSEFQVTLNQGLPEGWGNFFVVGSVVDYWNRSERNENFNVGYNNRFKSVSYGVSVMKRRTFFVDNSNSEDTQYTLNVSFPLSFGQRHAAVTAYFANDNRNVGISGSLSERLDYGATLSHSDYGDASFGLNTQYSADFMKVGLAYSYADTYQQANLSFSGNAIAHAGGVVFGPDTANTVALVYVPGAVGAKVRNTRGLSVNRYGYAVIPYMTPYRFNDIALDPSTMSLNVELEESSKRVAPYAGAILRVNFATKTGYAIFIKSKLANGDSMPFYSPVYNEKEEVVGNVAQGGLVYIRSQDSQGQLKVKLNDDDNSYCSIDFNVTAQVKENPEKVLMTEAVCK